MPVETYETDAFREWLGRVNSICMREFGRDIYHLHITVSFGEAFEDGATPEEFVETDIRNSLQDPSTQHHR